MALSEEAIEKLRAFSANANRGMLHHYDRQRWRQFIIQAHQDGSEIHDTDVSDFLRGEGWVEETAVELGGEYYESRQLLGDYDAAPGRR